MAISPKSLGLRLALLALALIAAAVAIRYWTRPVASVARVRSDMAKNAVSGSLIVQAEYTMELKSELGGRVARSYLDIDKHVKAGDMLLQLDAGDVLIEIEKTKSDLDAALRRQEIGNAIVLELVAEKEQQAEVERQNMLGLASDADVTRQKRRVQAVQQRLDLETIATKLGIETLENVLKGQKRKLEKMTLRAPFDGVVSQVFARPGDLISGGAPIALLISIGRTVEGRLSEENISGVKPGQKALVTFLPYGDDRFDAKVVKVLSTSDPQTQRYLIHLEVDSQQLPPAKLVPGITGEVSIILDERPAKAIVPRRALLGDKLFVVKGGRVELRSVKIGYVSLTAVEVLEGVNEGDLVIVDQQDRFSDGKSVRAVPTDDSRWK